MFYVQIFSLLVLIAFCLVLVFRIVVVYNVKIIPEQPIRSAPSYMRIISAVLAGYIMYFEEVSKRVTSVSP